MLPAVSKYAFNLAFLQLNRSFLFLGNDVIHQFFPDGERYIHPVDLGQELEGFAAVSFGPIELRRVALSLGT